LIPAEKDEVLAITDPLRVIVGETLTWIESPGFSRGDVFAPLDLEVGLMESSVLRAVVNTRGPGFASGFSKSDFDTNAFGSGCGGS
jgi:hypothetical protein